MKNEADNSIFHPRLHPFDDRGIGEDGQKGRLANTGVLVGNGRARGGGIGHSWMFMGQEAFEDYRGNQPGLCGYGQLFEFDDVKRKILMHTNPQSFLRVIGPPSATSEQLEDLRQMGARLTYP